MQDQQMTHSDKPQTPHRIVRNTKTVFVLSDQIWGWFVMQQEITKIDGFFGKLACEMRTKRLSGGWGPCRNARQGRGIRKKLALEELQETSMAHVDCDGEGGTR